MYAILIISLLLVLGTLKTIQNRKTIIDKLKSETVNAVDSNNYQELLNRVVALENGFLDKTYPVGSIYISISSDNPSTLFGGTWESFGQGRTLIGAGTNGGYTFTSESTGTTVGATTNPLGEYVHTLSVAEMPSHKHNIHSDWNSNNEDGSWPWFYKMINAGPAGFSDGSGSWTMDATGGSQSHNNIQPYIVTYMWKRTS